MKRRSFFLFFGAALAALAVPALAEQDHKRPMVVELFTSQGCSSCPPADAFLGELARRPEILALSLHVDYWDYLGWKDPFARKACTERQRAYGVALAQRYVYTPQMVIDGRLQGVGSDRTVIEKLISKAAKDPAAGPALALAESARGPAVAIGPGVGTGVVWRVLYDRQQTTAIARGENGGRTITYANVVRDLQRLGAWKGEALTLPLEIAPELPGERVAVVLQTGEAGPIIGALAFDRPTK